MASVWKHPNSKYWTACFTDKNGVRRKRSTGVTSQTEAARLAFQYEAAARKKLTKKKARRILADIYESLNGQPLPAESIEDFFDRWKTEQKNKVAPETHRKYSDECSRFIAHLGDKAKSDMDTITRADITSFQANLTKSLSVGTANTSLKILRVTSMKPFVST